MKTWSVGFVHGRNKVDRRSASLASRYTRLHCRGNPVAAQKVVSGIYEKVQVLRRFPEIGYKYRTEAEGEIRILLMGITGLPTFCGQPQVLIYWVCSTAHLTSTGISHDAV